MCTQTQTKKGAFKITKLSTVVWVCFCLSLYSFYLASVSMILICGEKYKNIVYFLLLPQVLFYFSIYLSREAMIIILAANGTLSRIKILSIFFLVFVMSEVMTDLHLSSFFDKFSNKTAPLSKQSQHSQRKKSAASKILLNYS